MHLSFTPLPDDYAITRLSADAPVPDWVTGDGLTSITRAQDELSIVCRASHVPTGHGHKTTDDGWTALRVETLAALDEPGVVMTAVTPISSAGLGVFVISTHLRDYVLVRTTEMKRVQDVLINAGHSLG